MNDSSMLSLQAWTHNFGTVFVGVVKLLIFTTCVVHSNNNKLFVDISFHRSYFMAYNGPDSDYCTKVTDVKGKSPGVPFHRIKSQYS